MGSTMSERVTIGLKTEIKIKKIGKLYKES